MNHNRYTTATGAVIDLEAPKPLWLCDEQLDPQDWEAFLRSSQDRYSRYFWVDFPPQRRDQ